MALDQRLSKFRNQYHQQLDVDQLTYPPSQVLLEPKVQEQIFHYFFDPDHNSLHPPLSYRRRILKDLLGRIETAIVDPNEDGISDDLMEHMALMATQKEPSAFEAAQTRTPVIYTSTVETDFTLQNAVVIKESRNLLSAGGSTGMRTWDAALHVANYLLQNRSLIQGKRVLELGAGTGFLSILCAGLLHASSVVATDGASEVVDLIKVNAGLNGEHFRDDSNQLCPEILEWGQDTATKLCDTYFAQEPCEVVIATDVTYSLDCLDALIDTFKVVFERNANTLVLLAARLRVVNTFEQFRHKCIDAGLKVQEIEFACTEEPQQTGMFHSHAPPIIIVTVSRSGSIGEPAAGQEDHEVR